jgi:sphingolipid delta-4 desaturase
MGHDHRVALQCIAMVFIQITISYIIKDFSWPMLILCAYAIGGTFNHSLSLGLHEIAHNLAFGCSKPLANRLLGFFANLPLGVPASITFKKYHLDHHKYQGDEIIDTDLPTQIEVKLFSTKIGKFIFIFLQPLFYSFRPIIVLPKSVHLLEVINLSIQLTFDLLIYNYFGGKSLTYLILGTFLGLGLHPIAG